MSSEMRAYVLRRILMLIPLLLGLSLVMFTLVHISPGDPAAAMMSPQAGNNPTFVEQTRASLGLDKPVPVLGDWAGAAGLLAGPVLALGAVLLWRHAIGRYKGAGG